MVYLQDPASSLWAPPPPLGLAWIAWANAKELASRARWKLMLECHDQIAMAYRAVEAPNTRFIYAE